MPHRIYLTPEEDSRLLELVTTSTAARRIRLRAEAIRLSHHGWSVPRIAEYLHCAESTVREAFQRWWNARFDALQDEAGRGRKSTWTPADLAFLEKYILESAQTWTTKQLVELLARERGVSLSADYLGRVLKKTGLSGSVFAAAHQK